MGFAQRCLSGLTAAIPAKIANFGLKKQAAISPMTLGLGRGARLKPYGMRFGIGARDRMAVTNPQVRIVIPRIDTC